MGRGNIVKSIKSIFVLLSFLIQISSLLFLPQNSQASHNSEEIAIRVRELLRGGNYRQALDLLSPFTADPMLNPDLFSDYIVILVWDGRHEEAIRKYENLPSSFHKRTYLKRNIAKAYYEQKNFSDASSLYRAVLEETPADKEAQKGLVFSLIQAGNYESASDYIESFLKEDPDSIPLILAKARLKALQDEYAEAIELYRITASREDIDSEHIYKTRDNLIESLQEAKRQKMLAQLLNASEKDIDAKLDYLVALILSRDHETAVGLFEALDKDTDFYTDNILSHVGWAYFKTGDTEKAEYYYRKVLEKNPDFFKANIGLSYTLAVKRNRKKAIEILDRLQLSDPYNIEILFARAFVYEQFNMFWHAILEYKRILAISPENMVARRLMIRALSDIGASSLALENAYNVFPDDTKFHVSLKGDMAVDRINWGEPVVAKKILLPIRADEKNLRARFDYIVALAENNELEEVIKEYENLMRDEISPPPWVLENAAKAYLYMEKPIKALELYNQALALDPKSFDGRMGKFYTLQELRKWKEAREVLDGLDRELPEILGQGKNIQPNWHKLEVSVVRGWFLAYEGRLQEAEKYFWTLREKAPANMGIRTGLAHVYYWRGWHRKALREFRIIDTLDPENIKAKMGRMAALNDLAFKEEAREGADKLLAKYPKNKHVQRLVRQFEVEEMRELVADFVYTKDEDGFEDIRAEITLNYPVSLYTTLYGSLMWQESSDDTQKRFYRRAALGIKHIFNSSWNIEQRFSFNYNDGKDFGSFTYINFTPGDYWSFDLSYDSFSTDVPLRARVFGIKSDKLELGITYRESDWRSYGLLLSHMKFSDGNTRKMALLNYEQGLFVKNDWAMRVFLELYTSRNSRDDAPYFNPEHDFSLSLTHLTQQTLWRIYRRAFVHKLFLTIGTYKQKGFGHHLIYSIRYQQEHDFSDTLALLWGVNLARRVYDGNSVNSYSLYLTIRIKF